MAKRIRIALEIGPKGKRVIAVAPDWPGLERGAKTEEAAIERLRSYLVRYEPVAAMAGLKAGFPSVASFQIVERYPGSTSTDFWGISFAYSDIDCEPMTAKVLERELSLMKASWMYFDRVRSRVSEAMEAGPRGGGRDRDQIVRHTLITQLDWTKKLGMRVAWESVKTDEGLAAHRQSYCDAIRQFHAEGKMARRWPLRYLIRHTAYHTLDHAWEMEDKDMTRKDS